MKTLLCLLCLAVVAQARLGEKLPECEARYGKARPKGERVEFIKGDIAVSAHFGKDGKCDYIFFTAHDLLKRRSFTDVERATLLKANNLGHLLVRKAPEQGGEIEWESADGEVGAVMVGNGSRIVFYTPAGKKALDASLEEEATKSTRGF
jgi:4-diphosphocytidyl-2C-methyl-D-erythritol kinase